MQGWFVSTLFLIKTESHKAVSVFSMVDIKNLISVKNSKEKKDVYWALLIEPGWVQAGVWTIIGSSAQAVSLSPPNSWKLEEEFISAADASLSASAQNLPEDHEEPSKTVFGVISSWVTGGEIKAEYLQMIKQACSKLSLEPVGFVVLSEAVSHYVKQKEGSPLSAVVLGVSEDSLELSIYRLGNLVGATKVARSVSLVDDVAEGLSRFLGSDPIPSRFILYGGKDSELEETRQSLVKGNWEDFEALKFLHPPKIEILDYEEKIRAVILAGASEIADISSVSSEEKRETVEEEAINLTDEDGDLSAEDLGFVLDKDIKSEEEKETSHEIVADEEISESPDISTNEARDEIKKRKFSFKVPLMKVKEKVSGILGFFSKKTSTGEKTGRKAFLIGFSVFISFLIAGFLFWWYYPKATVTVYLSAQSLEEKIEVLVDPDIEDPDYDLSILPGKILTETVSGDRTKSTTGTKTVGENASGEVIFYRVGPELTLAAQTTINGPDNLNFSLNETVTVASGSAGSPGTTKARVTAQSIGAQYNLAANTSFSVSNYSINDIEAKNEESFSGGSSREISAVSLQDQELLEENLTEELEETAENLIMDKLSENLLFVERSLETTSLSRNFSNKVGDEASTLKLSLELKVSAIAVDRDALISVAGGALKDRVPSGFVLREEQIDISFISQAKEGENYKLQILVKANLFPAVDPLEIAEKIKGRYPHVAHQYLGEEFPAFSRADIDFKPKLPGRLGTLPRVGRNIEIIIAAED